MLQLLCLSTCRPDAKSRKPETDDDHFSSGSINFREGYVVATIPNCGASTWEEGGLMLTSQSQQSKSFVPSTWNKCTAGVYQNGAGA